ncbi:hypothetical protein B566_EDAN009612 [Ephemera danica]|nr:hypothetical protein B566_EDAN009612 [Ephemera danica]
MQANCTDTRNCSRSLRNEVRGAMSGSSRDGELAPLAANFVLRNLVPPRSVPMSRLAQVRSSNKQPSTSAEFEQVLSSNITPTDVMVPGEAVWRTVGNVSGSRVTLDTIVWPGGDIVGPSPGGRSVFRVVTALAPPFVMEGLLEDGQCLRGLRCHRMVYEVTERGITDGNLQDCSQSDIEIIYAWTTQSIIKAFPASLRYEVSEAPKHFLQHPTSCCVCFRTMDNMTLLFSWEPEDEVTDDLPLRSTCCYGFAMDLLENIAQELEFDFHLYLVSDGLYGAKKWNHKAGEYEWNGIMGDLVSGAAHMSFAGLSVSSQRSEAVDFTAPFYFGGVSLLAAPAQVNEIPLLAFLLPFSPELWIAIFVSLNMTAIAVAIYEWLSPFGLNPWGRQRSKNFSMASALWVMWGLLCGHLVAFKAPKSWPNKFLINVWGGFSVIFVASYTANIAALIAGHFFQNSPSYHDRSVSIHIISHNSNQALWQHMQQYSLKNIEEGVARLRNGTLDMLIGDTADSISAVIAKYSNNGYLDILQEKWYGGLPCFRLETEMVQPRPLGVAAVAGVFLLLGLGFLVGLLILLVEHVFYRRCLPGLRSKPKGTVWRSRNVMFFSQKLYRFINCVELVSPHHAARELVHTLRQGHITSLFQKSVKRKEHEQRRRRKSKAQFFEMIQEIRRVQAEERDQVVTTTTSSVTSPVSELDQNDVRPRLEETGRRIARHHEPEPLPAVLCRKRSGRLTSSDSVTEVATLPRVPEHQYQEDSNACRKRSTRLVSTDSEISILPRQTTETSMLSRQNTEPSTFPRQETTTFSRQNTDTFSRQNTEEALLARKRSGRLTSSSSIEMNPQPPPPPPPPLPVASAQPVVVVVDKEAQWRKREGLLKQQLGEALREKQELLDRIKILERCIKEPP